MAFPSEGQKNEEVGIRIHPECRNMTKTNVGIIGAGTYLGG